MSHLLSISLLIAVFWLARRTSKQDYSEECDVAVREVQEIINQKLNHE